MDVKIMNLDVKIVNLDVKIVNLDVRWISGGSQVDRRWISGGSQVDLRWTLARAIVQRFFDFCRDVSGETILFESVFGRPSSKNGLRSRRSVRSCHEKVKKTLHRSEVRVTKYCKNHLKCTKMNSSPDLPDLPDLPDHVSGARMT